jgi:hypothetical protein
VVDWIGDPSRSYARTVPSNLAVNSHRPPGRSSMILVSVRVISAKLWIAGELLDQFSCSLVALIVAASSSLPV